MTITETTPKNPLENEPGLSKEDQDTAIRNLSLRQSASEVQHHLRRWDVDDEPTRPMRRQEEVLGLMPLLRGVAKLDALRVKRKSAKHFRAHEGDYQVQAVKDAAAEGKHTNFGT